MKNVLDLFQITAIPFLPSFGFLLVVHRTDSKLVMEPCKWNTKNWHIKRQKICMACKLDIYCGHWTSSSSKKGGGFLLLHSRVTKKGRPVYSSTLVQKCCLVYGIKMDTEWEGKWFVCCKWMWLRALFLKSRHRSDELFPPWGKGQMLTVCWNCRNPTYQKIEEQTPKSQGK